MNCLVQEAKEGAEADDQPVRTRSKSKPVLLAAAEVMLPSVSVMIEPLLIPEKIVSKRYNKSLGHYQYLVKFERLSTLHSAWLAPKKIRNRKLLDDYERRYSAETPLKQQAVSWFPFDEKFVVQWKDHPFFVVSYGAGQLNKFCIIGLDKTGLVLVCKGTKNRGGSRHLVHINMVKSLMTSKQLVIHNREIMSADQAAKIPKRTPSSTDSIFPSPLSTKPTSIFPSSTIQDCLIQHISSISASTSIPMDLVPRQHPVHCKCILPEGLPGQYKTVPEPMSGNAGQCKVWLLYGKPLKGRTVFYWRCLQNNPLCDVYYDGGTEGLFVHSNATVVSHLVPLDFLLQLVSGKGASFAGFVSHKELMNKLLLGVNETPSFVGKKLFIEVS